VTDKSVTWTQPLETQTQLQPNQLYPSFNETDLWYTRDNYKEFLIDRLQTIESHRFMAANNLSEGEVNNGHCIRGLELFQDETTNEQFVSKKKLYHSTIKMEQMRQTILGVKDPERFRALVAYQSDLALHRAQELAAQDKRDAYPFRVDSANSDLGIQQQKQQQQQQQQQRRIQNQSSDLPAPSRTDNMPRLSDFLETGNDAWSTPATALQNTECGAASVVSDNSSITSSGSNTNSVESSPSNSNGKSLFTDESVRKLQERSMRRLMGIYQNNSSGEVAEGASESESLFKFARRDSLLGLRRRDTTANTPSHNRVLEVPPEDHHIPSPKEQLIELLRQHQLVEEHRQQQQELEQQAAIHNESTSTLEHQVAEMLHQRQILQDHLQQQAAFSEETTPSLQEQLIDMIHRRQYLEEQQQQQEQEQEQQNQHISSILGAIYQNTGRDVEGDIHNRNNNHLVEEFLMQQQQHQQQHQNKMKLALMAMNASRFPIRRDTLSHVRMNSETESSSNLPWNVTSMV